MGRITRCGRAARRAFGASLLLGAAGAVTVAVAFTRSAARSPLATAAPDRRGLLIQRGAPDGAPVLVLGWDPACGACDRTLGEVGRLDLEPAGVAVVPLSRNDPAASACGVDRGPYPAWVLLDGSGRVLGVRRGYAPPEAVHRWVRGRLTTDATGTHP